MVATSNLAIGVVLGLVFTAIFFANSMSKISVTAKRTEQAITYQIQGQIFFASIEALSSGFDYKAPLALKKPLTILAIPKPRHSRLRLPTVSVISSIT